MGRTITGTEAAFVRLGSGHQVIIRRGEPLPDDIADTEIDRLDDLGVFDTESTPEPEPNLEPVDVEAHATGGGWYQIGDQKVRGEDAARQALADLEA